MNAQDRPDCIEAGSGPRVILVHSSVAGARQWARLMGALSGDFHLIALNLFGYGATESWAKGSAQTLEDQARLVGPCLPEDGGPVSIVGHSFGGSVAMKAAALFKGRVERLVLIEPNPFFLLRQHGRTEAFHEATKLRDTLKRCGAEGAWSKAAQVFADYWTGPGSWDAMPAERQRKFATALKPNFHEWDAVMTEDTPLAKWAADLPAQTTVISAKDTVRSIAEIVTLLQQRIPQWTFEKVDQGGHMAAVTQPDLINPIIARALQA